MTTPESQSAAGPRRKQAKKTGIRHMTFSLMNGSSPQHGMSGAQRRSPLFQASGDNDNRAADEAGNGAPDIMDDGLVCLLFDD